MRSDVVYEMRDLLKNPNLEVKFKSSVHEGKREWYASVNDIFMGYSTEDDVTGTYWFDSKNINFKSVQLLDDNSVPYTRG